MMRLNIFLLGLCFVSNSYAANDSSLSMAKDLYLREAVYYASQGDYFSALTQLDTKLKDFHRQDDPKSNPLHFNSKHAKFNLGDFETSYRLPQRAIPAIKAIMKGNIDQSLRNEVNFFLARIYQQNASSPNALTHIENISGRVPDDILEDELFLRAQVFMGTGNPDLAIKELNKIQGSSKYKGFSSYNLGIALIQNGQELEGLKQLDKTGQINSDDEGALAIKDKANLFLGNKLISTDKPALGKQYLERVRLNGPFSNTALFESGLVDVSLGKFDRALVPWSLLMKRDITDKVVQESIMGVPFSYSKLELYGKAALFYKNALEKFNTEFDRLDASIKSIQEGRLLKTLLRDELQQDKNWLVKLKELPASPETDYLLEMMASSDFYASLINYIDLNELLKKLEPWEDNLNAYEGIIQTRQQHYDSILPDIDKQFAQITSKMKLLLGQRKTLNERLKMMSTSPQPEFLETDEELKSFENLRQLRERYKNDTSASANETRQLIQHEEDLMQKKITASYDDRLNEAKKRAHQIDDDIGKLRDIYSSFEISRQAAIKSYKGYDNQIRQIKSRIQNARERVNTLKAKQGHIIEAMAVNELEQRKKAIEGYQTLARFSLSESYDLASKKQLEESGKK